MDILRRNLAPIGPEAWAEIDAMAKATLSAGLSARRFVDIDGPKGLDYTAVPIGRLELPKKQPEGGIAFGVHRVLPLVEARKDFTLRTWDLDDIARGAKDPDLDTLVAACKEMAAFEEKAVYDGFASAGIAGIAAAVKGKELKLKLDQDAITDVVAEAQARLLEAGIDGPANLVVSPAVWKFLSRGAPGGSLRSIVEAQIGGSVIRAELARDAILVSARGGDAELTLGQDFAIGYHSHSTTEIHLFVTESFTFRVIAPEAIVGLKLG